MPTLNFSSIKEFVIPEGKVAKIEKLENGSRVILWNTDSAPVFYYVSLGDSIAAGQAITDEESLAHPQVSRMAVWRKWQQTNHHCVWFLY